MTHAMEATPAQHVERPKGEPAQFVRDGKLEVCRCADRRALMQEQSAQDRARYYDIRSG